MFQFPFWKIVLIRLLVTAALVGAVVAGGCWLVGCGPIKAGMAEFVYGDDGSVEARVKGAGEGGTYNENKGLNLALGGENTLPALAIAAGVGLCILVAYPLQRSLRLHSEKKAKERYLRARQERLNEEMALRSQVVHSPGSPVVPVVPPFSSGVWPTLSNDPGLTVGNDPSRVPNS